MFDIKPLSPELIEEYLYFFDNMKFTENPDWEKCYCFSFHFVGTAEQWTKTANRKSVVDYIQEGRLKGYLVFSGNTPVGWCNVNDRNKYERLMKYYSLVDNPNDKVASIVCFLIHPDYRRQGIAQQLVKRIVSDYTKMGYNYLEAYPDKEASSCEKKYKGPAELYMKNGFLMHKEHEEFSVLRLTF